MEYICCVFPSGTQHLREPFRRGTILQGDWRQEKSESWRLGATLRPPPHGGPGGNLVLARLYSAAFFNLGVTGNSNRVFVDQDAGVVQFGGDLSYRALFCAETTYPGSVHGRPMGRSPMVKIRR